MAAISTTPFSTATPKSAMKPTDADRFRVRPRSHSAAMPPTSANGTFSRISSACRTRAERGEQQQEDDRERQRHDERQPGGGALLVLELPAPRELVAGRQRHRRGQPPLRLGDEAADVAPADVGLHDQPALGVLVVDGLGRRGIRRCAPARPAAPVRRRAR